MPRAPYLPTAILVYMLLISSAIGSEVSARISGNAAGPNCSIVAVSVTRVTLKYPLLGGLGWSRGVPRITRNVADLYLFQPVSKKLQLAASITAPRRWRDSTRYAMHPRILPDGKVIFMTRGCPKENENCTEALYFNLRPGGGYSELSEWPEVTAQESTNLKRCTSYLTYESSNVQVSIGPTGGPWKPVLGFIDNELTVLPQ